MVIAIDESHSLSTRFAISRREYLNQVRDLRTPTVLDPRLQHATAYQASRTRTWPDASPFASPVLGSLAIERPPAYPGYVEESEASVHNDLDNRPFVHHLKVVDSENEGEAMAHGKWEGYPGGCPDLEKPRESKFHADKEVDQYGRLREVAHEYFCSRNGEMGKQPPLLLALLVAAMRHRRQGAGSIVVNWGIEMAEATGLPYYLQASEQ
ncbi:hypothetical protein CONLIGDRAFT_685200 [Coniochaeta ligniaria NRRL 30616]|uniref:N-acetyltransferase domain-containing protein n=1 Tax=Coniochaeta ligniaria NRRL 30616 TaxID=1408157 RepID=A0A1J7ID09_9PEZI|nr:hypothetical protein CONLIGDRAFT_685200 [Coniochaeta ligniaria NRRL 30616]